MLASGGHQFDPGTERLFLPRNNLLAYARINIFCALPHAAILSPSLVMVLGQVRWDTANLLEAKSHGWRCGVYPRISGREATSVREARQAPKAARHLGVHGQQHGTNGTKARLVGEQAQRARPAAAAAAAAAAGCCCCCTGHSWMESLNPWRPGG